MCSARDLVIIESCRAENLLSNDKVCYDRININRVTVP